MRSVMTRWFFRPGPARALALWRISTNVYLLRYLVTRWKLINHTAAGHRRDFKPVGVARALPKPLPVRVVRATTVANCATTVLAGLGVAHRFTGPINSALTWWTLTYRNSWSMVFHTDNIVVLHTAALAVSAAADEWSVDALAARRAKGTPLAPTTSWRYGWPMLAANSLTVATYFVSGLAKLRGPLGWRWASGEHLRAQVAADGVRKAALRPDAAGPPSRLIELLDRHRWSWTAFAAGSLALELLAPIALVDRRIGRLWSLAAWSMHVGIKKMMDITFRYQLSGNPYLPFFIGRTG